MIYMADIVYMTKAAWTAILDAIRAKTGSTATMTASGAATAIAGITAGSSLKIKDPKGLFYRGARLASYADYIAAISPDATDFSYFLDHAGTSGSTISGDILGDALASQAVTMANAFSNSGAAIADTVIAAVSRSYPKLTSAESMFEYSNVTLPSKITLGLPTWPCDASMMFSYCKFEDNLVDFSGFDTSGVSEAQYMLNGQTTLTVTLPTNFMKHATSVSLWKAVTDDDTMALKFPEGFMSQPRATSGDTLTIDMTYLINDYMGLIKVVDINSDFLASPLASDGTSSGTISSIDFSMYSADLKALIIRTKAFIPLGTSRIASGNAGTKIFVPSALVDTYKAATNWSAYAGSVYAVENYTTDGTLTGSLDYAKAGITF